MIFIKEINQKKAAINSYSRVTTDPLKKANKYKIILDSFFMGISSYSKSFFSGISTIVQLPFWYLCVFLLE
jgi:hypothetical protein